MTSERQTPQNDPHHTEVIELIADNVALQQNTQPFGRSRPMPITSTRRINVVQQFVRLGFADHLDPDAPFYSGDFLTQELTTTEVQAAMSVLPRINTFVGVQVAGSLDRFRGEVRAWKFGRSGTPVLHVLLPFWTHQVEERHVASPVGAPVQDAEHRALIERLQHGLVDELDAFDFTRVDETDHVWRARWR